MTVHELVERLSLRVIALPDGDREAGGVYIGDLLSWVMGRAQAEQVWITIMSNRNIVAVASLSDVACILLCEGVEPDAEAIEAAMGKDINILSSPLSAYELAKELAKLGL